MRTTYRYEVNRLGAMLFLGLLVAHISGQTVLSFLLCILIYLSVHFYQLIRLIYLTDTRRYIKPPYPGGLWGEIYQALALHQSRSRKRKRGLVRFAARFREAAAAIPDALVILDSELRMQWANPATRSLLGCGWPESEGLPISELIDYLPLKNYIEAGEYSRPVDFVSPHNKALVLSLRVTPFGGKKHQWLLVARDITKIYHLNQIRRDFVANVSHELRTPLTVINGFLENLLDAAITPPNMLRPLNLMHSQAARMRSIIEDLLTLSRLEMDEKASDQIPIDMGTLVGQIIEEARALSNDRQRFDTELEPGLWLLGNEGEIRSALSNLVFNAVKHTPAGTHIRVIWQQNDQGLYLTVQDTGPGIPGEHLPRITERFYRVDKGRSRAYGGTGLGLAIVKHVLTRHEAELLIHSSECQGSIFTCHFPGELALLREPPGNTAKEAVL